MGQQANLLANKSGTAESWRNCWNELQIKGDHGIAADKQENAEVSLHSAFSSALLNFAENLLETGPRQDLALGIWNEDGFHQNWTRGQLKELAGRFAGAFYGLGLQTGNHVLIVLPEGVEKTAALLGASWMGICPSFIHPGEITRETMREDLYDQPYKLAMVCDGYRHDGCWQDGDGLIRQLAGVFDEQNSILVVPVSGSKSKLAQMPQVYGWNDWQKLGQGGGVGWQYQPFSSILARTWLPHEKSWFSHELGPALLSCLSVCQPYKKEMQDGVMFMPIDLEAKSMLEPALTLLPAILLATGGRVILYDGADTAMNGQVLWRIIEREQVNVLILPIIMDKWKKLQICNNHFMQSVSIILNLQGNAGKEHMAFLEDNFENAEVIDLRPAA